jgi:hypothetical protein
MLGKTGLKLSQLGFGGMRLPMVGEGDGRQVDREKAIPMIHRAFEAGVNYIDTAVFYCNADSQRVVGEALQGWRDKVVVSTKNHYYGEDEKAWWKNLEDSLQLLQVETIDVYNHHGLNWHNFTAHIEPRMGKWMEKARDQGLIKHICCSFHDSPENLLKIVDSGYPEAITLQYNLLDRSLEEGIARAAETGIGIIAMGPVGGGRLGADTDAIKEAVPGIERVPELALRFVLANPGVSVALSGMSTMEQVEENVAVASDDRALTDEEQDAIEAQMRKLKEMAELYCTGCEYCLPCPENIAIPQIFSIYNEGRVYGLWEHAKRRYQAVREGRGPFKEKKDASACTECGTCEERCPQDIPIRKQLKEAHEALADTDGA